MTKYYVQYNETRLDPNVTASRCYSVYKGMFKNVTQGQALGIKGVSKWLYENTTADDTVIWDERRHTLPMVGRYKKTFFVGYQWALYTSLHGAPAKGESKIKVFDSVCDDKKCANVHHFEAVER
jgi:hypothetical protein